MTAASPLSDPQQIADRTQARDYLRARRAQAAAEAFAQPHWAAQHPTASRSGMGL